MPEFIPGEEFEPSNPLRKTWLATEKKPHTMGDIRMPGLFQTDDHLVKLISAGLAIVALECSAAWITINEGALALWAVAILVVFDIAWAIISHIRHGIKCELENRNVFEDNATAARQRETEIKKHRRWSYYWYFVILVSASTKIYFFASDYQVINAKALWVIGAYSLGAILHIRFTGYLIVAMVHLYSWSKQHRTYHRNGQYTWPQTPVLTPIRNPNNIPITQLTVRVHSIVKQNDTYYFQTFGVLTDNDLRYFVIGQNDPQHASEEKRIIIREGIRLQIEAILPAGQQRGGG